jgi:hypothetical protein
MESRQPAVWAGPGEGDGLGVLPPARSPARASALARTTSGSRGSAGRASCHGCSRRALGRWIRICCIVSHLLGRPPHLAGAGGGQPGPGGPALRETVRILPRAGRHPKVPARWNIAARRSVTRRCYLAGWGAAAALRRRIRVLALARVRVPRQPPARVAGLPAPAAVLAALPLRLLTLRAAAFSRPDRLLRGRRARIGAVHPQPALQLRQP